MRREKTDETYFEMIIVGCLLEASARLYEPHPFLWRQILIVVFGIVLHGRFQLIANRSLGRFDVA